jgi:prepilin-type N-terminal cleavage/methylation domain-containing protein/prepilin-type processing-associated H-X9-DG protein
MLQKRCRGFTLIELLVVIAIIAILAAILFPTFMMAKRQAAATTCLGNMKQIGAAIMMYVDDNHGHYPLAPQGVAPAGVPASNWDSYGSSALGCVGTFAPYCKTMRIWMCPSGGQRDYHATTYKVPSGRTTSNLWCAWAGATLANGQFVRTNYSAYAFNQHSSTNTHPNPDYLCARGKRPLEFSDECRRYGYQSWLVHDSYTYSTSHSLQWSPHKGGLNGCFYDGHAKWIRDSRFTNIN